VELLGIFTDAEHSRSIAHAERKLPLPLQSFSFILQSSIFILILYSSSPSPMLRALFLLLLVTLAAQCARPSLAGLWRSEKQSRAGRATLMRIHDDNTLVVTTGLFIDYRYSVKNSIMKMRQVSPAGAKQARTYKMLFNGDTLRLILEAGDTTTLVRATTVVPRSALAGTWTRLNTTKGSASVVFDARSSAHMRWIYHSDTSAVHITRDSLRMSMKGGTVLRVKYRLSGNKLQLFRSPKEHPVYLRVKDE
jgi:hypothetical protein